MSSPEFQVGITLFKHLLSLGLLTYQIELESLDDWLSTRILSMVIQFAHLGYFFSARKFEELLLLSSWIRKILSCSSCTVLFLAFIAKLKKNSVFMSMSINKLQLKVPETKSQISQPSDLLLKCNGPMTCSTFTTKTKYASNYRHVQFIYPLYVQLYNYHIL